MSEQIISRQAEEHALIDFLDMAPHRPCALVIEGDPGIGKTTMWLDAVARARDRGFRVLASRAAAAESVLAYCTLADLLNEVDDAIWAELPAPQQQGLDAATLRRRDGARETDARAVAAAFVAVIDRLAAEGPVLFAIDDLQWLDVSSANAMSFAARRLPIGAALLCTTRTAEAALRLQLPSLDAVHRIRMQPLTIGELHQVLTLRLGRPLPRSMLLRIQQISAGNPFYALELAREIGTGGHTTELALPASLGELVRTRIGRVGAGAEDALLAMACLPNPTVQLVAQAAAPHPSASWKRSPTPKQRRWWPSMETVSTSPTPCWHMASTAAQRLAAAAPCTGGWPNSSSNPNYGRVTSRCPIPPVNRVPSKPLTLR